MGPSCDAAPNEYKHSSLVRLLVIDFAVFKAEQTYESKQTTELKEQCYVVKWFDFHHLKNQDARIVVYC